jgi:2,3-diketo-5-methylthio-1-phosphopentane phosphatase
MRNSDLSRCQVFFDFDNTIVTFDVLDDLIQRFAKNRRWQTLEEAWQKGTISSGQCLKGQLGTLRIKKKELLRYLSRIKIDRYFPKLLSLFKRHGIKPLIVSDSFSFLIENILRNNGIKGIKVYSNKLKFQKNRLIPVFPHMDKACLLCAHCKKNTLLNNVNNGKLTIYIGDGLSDICPARYADLVFAKDKLLKHYKAWGQHCIEFGDLGDVYRYFMGVRKNVRERKRK